MRRHLLAFLSACVLAMVPVAVSAAPSEATTTASVAAASAKKVGKCKASMSVSKPRQYSYTTVRVSNVESKANVTTTAHYKTTKTRKSTKASSKGNANLEYYISGATPGKSVTVTVTATKGKKSWACSTSFTPKKK
ncbi:hypothetical protein LWF01_01465 [Saxibacter everestensis]|uniref:Uncharacterized protein n=1 Tax=Saxibacter everestensis TaxID=2909229 RepID=A0ABY8QU06_9MICO|nr:hypothetical protein LWF01_01465 [Brevibacteriaceae bacterium ZFBP1038]